ncbi:metal-dependent hydrolase [Thermochromatium tepidum]|uniref:Metal-dependent hydrolase n=1 Tax=Thermochromatium tepidum ATCC 43061 TaxID=316276 RepID=A0A6I6E178_THETI|nr:metal-dependent hydrolase [Thermochromatium tepidum]QGU33691.1 metal-dependent hydrolase [Thermochromatium tepidum ATCC 43061]
MANFQTHLNVGILVSAAATLSMHAMGLSEPSRMPILFVLGVAGSLLPDIDLKHSKPTSALFNVLGALLAFALTLPLTQRFQPLDLAVIWTTVFFTVRYGVLKVFSSLTVHRGVWHSWLAVAVVSLATTNLAYWLGEPSAERAWTAGLMIGLGYLTHLVLDEFSSVDLFNAKVKRSFGTALKPISLKYPWSTLAMTAVLAGLIATAPPVEGVLERFDLDPRAVLAGLETWMNQGLRWATEHLQEWWPGSNQSFRMPPARG